MDQAEKFPKKKQNLKQYAYNYIKTNILNCHYAPNTFLNELTLCNEMEHISRTPVRDALGRLEQEGLIIILPKKGIVISPIHFKDINKIYEVRNLIETYSLQKYGSNISLEKLMEFKGVCEKGLASNIREEKYKYYDMDDAFHMMIINCLQNKYLIDTYENITDLNHRLIKLAGRNISLSRIDETFHEHLAIITPCLKGNWKEAVAALEKHLEKSRTVTIEQIIDSDTIC